MTKSDLWKLGVADIIAATRSGERSATDIVEAAIDRMDQVNPALNAVVTDLSDQARQRAADLDRARESGADLGPLHGVPVTIKVNVDQAGWAPTNGVKALENLVAVSDAPGAPTRPSFPFALRPIMSCMGAPIILGGTIPHPEALRAARALR